MVCKNNRKKYFICIIISLFILVILYNKKLTKTINGYSAGIVPNSSTVSLLSPNNSIIQEFHADEDNFYALDILISTYNRINDCHINFLLMDEEKIIFQKKINAKNLQDNSYFRLNFKELYSKNKKYRLLINSPDSNLKNTITFWKTDKENKNMKLFINNLYQKNNLRFIIYRKINGLEYLNTLFSRISLNNLSIVNSLSLHLFLFIKIFVACFINISFIEIINENITSDHSKKRT